MKYLLLILFTVFIFACKYKEVKTTSASTNVSVDSSASFKDTATYYDHTPDSTKKGPTVGFAPDDDNNDISTSSGAHGKMKTKSGHIGFRRKAPVDRIPASEPTTTNTATYSDTTFDKKITTAKNPNPAHELGLINYDIPHRMKYQTTYTLKFAINRDTTDKSIVQSPNSTTATIHTSETMQVNLIDPLPESEKAFEIVKNNSAVQFVDKNDATAWYFDVTPIRGGVHELHLIVSIIRNGNKKETVYKSSVQVEATITDKGKSFIEKYWQWLAGTIVIPLLVWFFVGRKKDK